MIERLSRAVPFFAVLVALVTGGAWLAMPPMQPPPPPNFPQQPYPPPPPQKPAPRSSDCASCADCDCSGCDVSDCDVSGCDCDVSGCDCSYGPSISISALRSYGLLTLLLPLALLDAWRRRAVRQEA